RARSEPGVPPAPCLRGRTHAGALPARAAARRPGRGTPRARGAHLRARRPRDPRPDRRGRLRRLRAPPDADAGRARPARPPGALAMSLPAVAGSPLAAAYDHCEALTRRASSNFYWGFRLLPHDRRRALCAVYAFCRVADDMADAPG